MPTVDGWITNFFPYIKEERNVGVTLETLYERAKNPPADHGHGNGPGKYSCSFFFIFFF